MILPGVTYLFSYFTNYEAAPNRRQWRETPPSGDCRTVSGSRGGQDIEQIGLVTDIGHAAGEFHRRDVHEEQHAAARTRFRPAGDCGVTSIGRHHHAARA